MSLIKQQCQSCYIDAKPATDDEIEQWLAELPEWELVTIDSVPQLERTFSFQDFAGALAFTNKVGELAESSGHHPEILLSWGSVRVRWWTHAINNLHQNDFVHAAHTSQFYPS